MTPPIWILYEQAGIPYLWLPTKGGTAPSQKQIQDVQTFIDQQNSLGNGVAIHCTNGKRRTGTLLAAYLIQSGSSYGDAMQTLSLANADLELREAQTTFLQTLSESATQTPWTHLLIIGGSDAGISAALRAREVDPAVEVTVVVADAFPNYSLCGLPFFLSGEVPDWRSLAHRTASEIESKGIRLLLNHTAQAIDATSQTVDLLDAEGKAPALVL